MLRALPENQTKRTISLSIQVHLNLYRMSEKKRKTAAMGNAISDEFQSLSFVKK